MLVLLAATAGAWIISSVICSPLSGSEKLLAHRTFRRGGKASAGIRIDGTKLSSGRFLNQIDSHDQPNNASRQLLP